MATKMMSKVQIETKYTVASTLEDAIDTSQSLKDQSNQPKRKGGQKLVKSYPHLAMLC